VSARRRKNCSPRAHQKKCCRAELNEKNSQLFAKPRALIDKAERLIAGKTRLCAASFVRHQFWNLDGEAESVGRCGRPFFVRPTAMWPMKRCVDLGRVQQTHVTLKMTAFTPDALTAGRRHIPACRSKPYHPTSHYILAAVLRQTL
jgi:hypothetical protein